MLESMWISLFNDFCWSTVALPCCVSSCCGAQGISHTCTRALPSQGRRSWAELPMLWVGSHQTCSIQSGVYVSVPISRPIHSPSPPWHPDVCSLHLRLYFQKASEFLIFKVLETEMQKFSDLSEISPPVCSNWRSKLNHSSIIYNSPNMEATQGSMDGWLVKQQVIYTYRGIPFSLKKGRTMPRATAWMDLETWR